MAELKRSSLNEIEKALPEIRRRVSALPEEARFRSFVQVYAQVLWLRDKFGELAIELYRLENQEEICFDSSTDKNED